MTNHVQNNIIIHVSEVNISPNGGMGRVEWNWKQEFERRGYQFIHIGPREIGSLKHPGLFPYRAYQYFKKLNITPLLLIVHEPAGGIFVKRGFPIFIESHGLEQRHWELNINGMVGEARIPLKTRLLFPLWRLRSCNKGLKYADFLLLINEEDKYFVKDRFKIVEEKICLFKNGAYSHHLDLISNKIPKIIFNASWIERKGIRLLVTAATALYRAGFELEYLLIGTGRTVTEILKDWPEELHSSIEIIPKFESDQELSLLSTADIFILPSYYEGQPLSLLQAMAVGLCCITTNCCGQKDLIVDGKNGYLFEKGNAQQLIAIIEKWLSNRNNIDSIGNNAKKIIQQRTWDITNKETVDFILNAVKKVN